MQKKLKRNYFKQDTTFLAKDFLGKYLVRNSNGKKISARIVETEAYLGPFDRAAHSHRMKRTPRTEVEYRDGGYVYIYLVYGMYWQLNIVTSVKEKPECVLIRAVEIIPEHKKVSSADARALAGQAQTFLCSHPKDHRLLTNGPGKLCNALKLNGSFNGEDLTTSNTIWVEDRGEAINQKEIIATKRIGIDYAGPYWARRKLRFYIQESLVKKIKCFT